MKTFTVLLSTVALCVASLVCEAGERQSTSVREQEIVIPSHAGTRVRAASPKASLTGSSDVSNTSADAYYVYYDYTISSSSSKVSLSWAPCGSWSEDDASYAFAGGWGMPTGLDITRSKRKSGSTNAWEWSFGKQSSLSGKSAKVQLNVICTVPPKDMKTSSGSATIATYSGSPVYMTCGSEPTSEFITGFESLKSDGTVATNGYVFSVGEALYYANWSSQSVTFKVSGICGIGNMYFPEEYIGYDAEVGIYQQGNYELSDDNETVSKYICSDDKWETDILSLWVSQDAGRLQEFNNVVISNDKACLRMKISNIYTGGNLNLGYVGATEFF